jgi:hypothetical protein
MSDTPDTRWRLVRDVAVFQVKAALEAVLDVTLIPLSLVAAGIDLLLGNWQRPRWFHAVLRFGERCEERINLWGVAPPGAGTPQTEVDAVMRSIEALVRRPGVAPDKVRELRRWAAAKLAPGDDATAQVPERRNDPAG